MLVDYPFNKSYQKPQLSTGKGLLLSLIFKTIENTCDPFIKAVKQPNLKKNLNENDLTQLLVNQLQVQMRKLEPPISVNQEYSDVFNGEKGIPDFYFYLLEEEKTHKPFIVFESKRLFSKMRKDRRKEYVKGNSENGGIERFKIGKHGKNMDTCGMIGFVEDENFEFWLNKINSWILELEGKDNPKWESDESLKIQKSTKSVSQMNSIVHRSKEDLILKHFWIKIN